MKKKFQDLEINIDTLNKDVPIYIQIKRQILAYAQSHGFCQDDPMPDITTISKAAGVSLRTANQAMEALATDGYCYRRAKHGSYYQEPSCRKRRICAVLLSKLGMHDDEIEFFHYNGIYTFGIENNIDVASVHSSPEEAFKFYSSLDRVEFLGMIILGEGSISATLALAERFPKKNFVFLCPRVNKIMGPLPKNCYVIMNDDYDGGYRIAEYYAAQGVRRMAILTMDLDGDESYNRRVEGFIDAAKKYGISFDHEKDFLNCRQSGKFYNQRQRAYLAVREYLAKRQDPPEIIFTVNDNFALGAVEAINDCGYENKINVTGYDGIFSYNAFDGGFSTVKVPLIEKGRMALSILEHPEKFENRNEIKPELSIVTRGH